MMNLLIAIISERFGIVLEQMIPMDCLERCNLILEIESFIEFINRWKKSNKGDVDGYLHFARYNIEDEDDAEDANAEVEGRMRAMLSKLNKMHKNITNLFAKVRRQQQKIQRDAGL